MLEALRDPFWQFVVGAVLTLATLIVGILGLRVYRNRKRLGYRIVSQQSVLSVQQDLEGRVGITFDGQPVHDVRLTILHIRNTGNVPIQDSDYVQPVGFTFGEGTTVLDTEVVKKTPPNMSVSLETKENEVVVMPDIFNGGDALTFKVLTAGGENVTVQGRVAGVSQIREISGTSRSLWDMTVSFGVPTLLTAIIIVTLIRRRSYQARRLWVRTHFCHLGRHLLLSTK